MRLLISLFSLLILSGCVSLDLTRETPESILKKSSLMVKQKRWAEAEELLSEGAQKFPNDAVIRNKLKLVRSDWQKNKQRLNNWMLLYEIEAMLAQRPLLESMSESDPDDIILSAKLQLHNASLSSKRALLIACAENHLGTEINLARRCAEAARIINESPKVQELLTDIEQKQQGIKEEQVARNRAEQRTAAIAKARQHLEFAEYSQVVQLLEPFVTENTNDPELNVLFQEAKAGHDLQVLQLISQGDRLYRSEKTAEALAIWQQAEQLDPDFEDLNTRIVRAKKVLQQLQKIKEGK